MRNQRPKCNRRGLFELHTATTRRELDLATSATHSIHNDSALREPSNCHGFDVGYFDACFCFALSRQLLNRRKLHVSVTVYGTEARKAGTSNTLFLRAAFNTRVECTCLRRTSWTRAPLAGSKRSQLSEMCQGTQWLRVSQSPYTILTIEPLTRDAMTSQPSYCSSTGHASSTSTC